ncbi:FRG domain-containing protein [Rhodobacteraceae bacterium RKSG542]|uniref:FRG domain-containing protein n=1 Tax=Pseudovibrio flavus TaxID=2529854 RepID=UPI0012BBB3E8|nr:FRG domain-containing protein [Pseudovibrio flavus]MTI16575.1 FRG domain-containing protein [Pseudovibrio flavus]
MNGLTLEASSTYTVDEQAVLIESVSDILEILQRPYDYLSDVLGPDPVAPVGYTDDRFPRPFSAGLWFRGDGDANQTATPSIFRQFKHGQSSHLEENNLTAQYLNSSRDGKLSLRMLEGMLNDGLPTRLLEWTGNILEATATAIESYITQTQMSDNGTVSSSPKGSSDMPAIYILNAYRLNMQTSAVLTHAELFVEDELDVILRVTQAISLYTEDVIATALRAPALRLDQKCLQMIEALESTEGQPPPDFLRNLAAPIAVYSTQDPAGTLFTLHGGKLKYFETTRNPELKNRNFDRNKNSRMPGQWNFLPEPIELYQLNEHMQATRFCQFMKKFLISPDAVHRIRTELDRLGIRPRTQAGTPAHKPQPWQIRGSENFTLTLPRLERPYGSNQSAELYDEQDMELIREMHASASETPQTNEQ